MFLKGCPLKCPWCHNPESKSFKPQLSYNRDVCVSCGKCQQVCRQAVHAFPQGIHTVDFSRCVACGDCIKACSFSALKLYGQEQSVQDVFFIVEKDKAYYAKSGGGVTVSGGEPLYQAAFVEELFRKAKEAGISTCLETSGAGKTDTVERLTAVTDLFLFDIKASRRQYPTLIGIDFSVIYRNLCLLEDKKAAVRLRLPMIPGVNDDEERLDEVLELSRLHCVQGVEILPYHDIGRGKAQQIGAEYPTGYQVPPEAVIRRWQEKLASTGKLVGEYS